MVTVRKRYAFAAEILVLAIELADQVIPLIASPILFGNNNGFVVTGM
jgi:hypothetical protein